MQREKIKELDEETENIRLRHQKILKMTSGNDFLAALPKNLLEVCHKQMKFTLSCEKRCSQEKRALMISLIERNMKVIYEKAWGWDFEAKEFELLGSNSIFYFLTADDSSFTGFIHFKFEEFMGKIVSFIYDIQLDPDYQHIGLGSILLQAVEIIATKRRAEGLATMVFKSNPIAIHFFETHGYTIFEMPSKKKQSNSNLQHLYFYKALH